MNNANVIKRALAASLAAGALCFASTAADVTTTAERAEVAEPAPAGPATTSPFTAPRYFNPYTPRQDNPTNPPGTWEVYPSPTGNDLYCVDFVDANNGWAGGRSVALRYRNGTWSVISGHSGHVFYDMDMLSLNEGWAVGWNGIKEEPAIWRWDGSDWKEHQNVTGMLRGVHMINATRGWIAGNKYFLRFNGTNWEWGGSAPQYMYGIYMFSDTAGWAAGWAGALMHRVGNNWVHVPGKSNWALASIWMLSDTDGWASGYDRTSEYGLIINCRGGTWYEHSIFNNTVTISELFFENYRRGWAVGWATLNTGLILFYDGNKWERLKPDPPKGVMGINKFDYNNGWGVGAEGLILKYKANVPIKATSIGFIKAIYR